MEPHGKRATDPNHAGSADCAAMAFNNGFGDGQTKTDASVSVGSRFVCTVESLKNMREILGGYALSVITDGEDGRAVFSAYRHPHLTPRAVVVDGVAHQICHNLSELLGVAYAGGVLQLHLQTDAVLCGEGTQRIHSGLSHA